MGEKITKIGNVPLGASKNFTILAILLEEALLPRQGLLRFAKAYSFHGLSNDRRDKLAEEVVNDLFPQSWKDPLGIIFEGNYEDTTSQFAIQLMAKVRTELNIKSGDEFTKVTYSPQKDSIPVLWIAPEK